MAKYYVGKIEDGGRFQSAWLKYRCWWGARIWKHVWREVYPSGPDPFWRDDQGRTLKESPAISFGYYECEKRMAHDKMYGPTEQWQLEMKLKEKQA